MVGSNENDIDMRLLKAVESGDVCTVAHLIQAGGNAKTVIPPMDISLLHIAAAAIMIEQGVLGVKMSNGIYRYLVVIQMRSILLILRLQEGSIKRAWQDIQKIGKDLRALLLINQDY
jgi:hypothetical protein